MTRKLYNLQEGEKIKIPDWEIFHDILKGGGVGDIYNWYVLPSLNATEISYHTQGIQISGFLNV